MAISGNDSVDSAIVDLALASTSSVIKSLVGPGKNFFGKIMVDAEIGFKNYINNSYKKVVFFKTLFSSDSAINIHEIYVSPKFSFRRKILSDEQVISEITSRPARSIVVGTGGSGKSIFMKYMYAVLCESGSLSKVPVFFELKSLNGISKKDIVSYIYHSNVFIKEAFTKDQFIYGLQKGAFILILDAFDETDYNDREKIEEDIIAISSMYRECPLIVSGRSDPRFNSWQAFDIIEIKPFDKKQTIDLIKKFRLKIKTQS